MNIDFIFAILSLLGLFPLFSLIFFRQETCDIMVTMKHKDKVVGIILWLCILFSIIGIISLIL